MNLLADTAGWLALYDQRDKYQAGVFEQMGFRLWPR